jgi:hypothetical protein
VFFGLSSLQGIVGATLAAAPELNLPRDQWNWTPTPEWIAVDPGRQALEHAGLADDGAPLGRADLVPAVAGALEKSPWVESVRATKGPASFSVEIRYRQPVLFVPVGEGTRGCYVDRHGIVIPAEQARSSGLREAFIFEGRPQRELPGVGNPFTDPHVVEAAKLADFLLAVKVRLDLAAIVGPSEQAEWTLRARRGSRFLWGRLGAVEQEEEKLARMLQWGEQNRGREPAAGNQEVDLRPTSHVNVTPADSKR